MAFKFLCLIFDTSSPLKKCLTLVITIRHFFLEPSTLNCTFHSYKNFDSDAFAQHLASVPFSICHLFEDPNDAQQAFSTLLKNVIDEHAPMKTRKLKANPAPTMNKAWRKEINYRTALRTKFRKHPTEKNYEKYRKQRNLCVSLRRRSLCNYFRENCKDGPKSKSFWPTIKPFLSKKCRTADRILLCEGNQLIEEPDKVAEVFNDYFVNVANTAPAVNITNHPSIDRIRERHQDLTFDFHEVDPELVTKHIQKLSCKKATGCDDTPPKLLKPYASILAPDLCKIINLSISSGIFPDELKLANVSPIFEKDDNLFKTNFRPVSILPR